MHFNHDYRVVANQPALPGNAPAQQNANQAPPPPAPGEFREGGRVVIQPYIRPKRFTMRVGIPGEVVARLFVYMLQII